MDRALAFYLTMGESQGSRVQILPGPPHSAYPLSYPLHGFPEGPVLLGKREPYLLPSQPLGREEARGRDSRHAAVLDKMLRETQVVALPDGAKVGEYVVRALRLQAVEPQAFERLHEVVALPRVALRQPGVIGVVHAEAGERCLLERGGGADRQEVVHLPYRVGEGLLRHGVADPPSRHAVGLRGSRDGHRRVRHVPDRREAYVPLAVVDYLLIDFVRYRQDAVVSTEVGYEPELAPREDPPRRVV